MGSAAVPVADDADIRLYCMEQSAWKYMAGWFSAFLCLSTGRSIWSWLATRVSRSIRGDDSVQYLGGGRGGSGLAYLAVVPAHSQIGDRIGCGATLIDGILDEPVPLSMGHDFRRPFFLAAAESTAVAGAE